jgi:hypothetical protein
MMTGIADLHRARLDLADAQQALLQHQRRQNLDPQWRLDLRELQGEVARLSARVRELSERCNSSAA